MSTALTKALWLLWKDQKISLTKTLKEEGRERRTRKPCNWMLRTMMLHNNSDDNKYKYVIIIVKNDDDDDFL